MIEMQSGADIPPRGEAVERGLPYVAARLLIPRPDVLEHADGMLRIAVNGDRNANRQTLAILKRHRRGEYRLVAGAHRGHLNGTAAELHRELTERVGRGVKERRGSRRIDQHHGAAESLTGGVVVQNAAKNCLR